MVVLAVNLLALREFFHISSYSDDNVLFLLTLISGSFLNIGGYLWGERGVLSLLPLFLLVLFISRFFVNEDIKGSVNSIGFGLLGLIFISLLLSYIILIGHLHSGRNILTLVLFDVWCVDTFAYYTGKNWGRQRLSPVVSPNKTIEGSIGGFAGGIIFAVLLWGIFFRYLPFFYVLLLSCGVGILAQLGDLAESLFKRWAGVKDSGSIFPGHGGMLDRIDSLLFILPFTYYLTVIFSI